MDADLNKNQRLAERLIRGATEPDELLEAGRHLAIRLYELSEDDQLWSNLCKQGPASRLAELELAVLPLVDWNGLLAAMGYDEPPSLAFAAGQGRALLTEALDAPSDEKWQALRDHLVWLAGDLGKKSDEPWARKNDNAREHFKFLLAEGFTTVRKLDFVKIAFAAAPDVVDVGLVVFAPPVANLAIILTKMAVKVGISVANGVSTAKARLQSERANLQLVDLVGSPAFEHGAAGQLHVELQTLLDTFDYYVIDSEIADGQVDAIRKAAEKSEQWSTVMSAELFAAWGYVAVLAPTQLDNLEALGQDLLGMVQAQRDIRRTESGHDPSQLRDALTRLVDHQARIAPSLMEVLAGLGPSLSQNHGPRLRMA